MKLQLRQQLSWYYHNDYEKIQHLKGLMYDMLEENNASKLRMLVMRLKADPGEDKISLTVVKQQIIKELEIGKAGILALLLL